MRNSRARSHLQTLPYMLFSSAASSIFLFVILIFLGITYTGFSATTYGYLFGLGFISHAIGFLSIVYAQAHVRPSRVSTILLAQPLITLLLALTILREQPSSGQWLGMGTLFLGIVLANRR